TVMRPRTIPILAAVALSLAVPSNADARLRFGPAALLGAVVGFGAMFGGYRHSARHHRGSATYASARHRPARVPRIERGTRGWRASTGGGRACACCERSPTCGERACRIDGSGTSPADGAGTFRPDGSGTSRADDSGASRARADDILARCRR